MSEETSKEKDIVDHISKCPRETHSNWIPILEKYIYDILIFLF